MSTTPGNPGNLLEFVGSSWKFLCKMSMIDMHWFPVMMKLGTGSLIQQTDRPFLSLPRSMLCMSCFCSIFRQTSRFGTLHRRPKQCKHVLDFS